MGTKIFIAILATLTLMGCGGSSLNSEQRFNTAPKNDSDLGLLVMGAKKSELKSVFDKNPQAQFRVISPQSGVYEVRGVSKMEILEASPKALVEKNSFIKKPQNKKRTLKEMNFSLFSETPQEEIAALFNSQNCKFTHELKTPEIFVGSSSAIVSVDSTVVAYHSEDLKEGEFAAWYFQPPLGSKLAPALTDSESFDFVADSPGEYELVFLYRKDGECTADPHMIGATFNEPYQPTVNDFDQSARSRIAGYNFKHLDNINLDIELIRQIQSTTAITVAVIDTGVHYNHPALKSAMWTNDGEIPNDGIDNDNNGYVDDIVGYDFVNGDNMPTDDSGHGTHVAGLITGDFMGAGLHRNISVMALKGGGFQGVDLGSYMSSLSYAIENGADIINLSLGSPQPSAIIERLLTQAESKGILVVAASGNGDYQGRGVDNDQIPMYPASYELSNIISVGSSTENGELTSYSNYGKKSVDIVTVGGYITSSFGQTSFNEAILSAYISNPSDVLVQPLLGTSMATPLVAGTAALILTVMPDLSPAEMRELLMDNGQKVEALKDVTASGAMLDSAKSLESVLALF